MASALEKIMKGTLQKSDSQKAFSPWWEDLEYKLLYTLLILGMITLPFNMVSNTPVECTLDQLHPTYQNMTSIDQQPMRYHHFYLRKFCTMNFIHDTMIFLPFFLLLTPLPIVGIEKVCLRYFKVEKRMESFYKLVVKESLDREDVEALEKENFRNSHEVLQMFRESNAFYHSLIWKSLIQLFLGSLLTAFVFWICFEGLSPEDISCIVFERQYVCVVPLATFYHKIIVVSMWAMVGYVLCNFWMLLWVLFRRLSPFHSFMTNCFKHIDEEIIREKAGERGRHFIKCLKSTDEDAYPFFDMYLDPRSKDLGLLINLLSCTHGVAEGLRMLALFDKEYKLLWKPLDVKVYMSMAMSTEKNSSCDKQGVVHVEWDDCPLADYLYKYRGHMGDMRLEYTVELVPSSSEAPLITHSYREKKVWEGWEEKCLKYSDRFCGVEVDRPKKPRLVYQPHAIRSMSVVSEAIEDLPSPAPSSLEPKKKTPEYKVIISVEVNGRTIAQRTEKVSPASISRQFDRSSVEPYQEAFQEADEFPSRLAEARNSPV